MTETTTTPKTDLDKFYTERNAEQAMRDDLFFLLGWTQVESPEIAKKLNEILKQHGQNREQNWL